MLYALGIWFAFSVMFAAFQKNLANLWKQPVGLFLWALALAICAAVDFDWWGKVDPLGWLGIFGKITEWFFNHM